MRVLLSTAVLLAATGIGYLAAPGASAQVQSVHAGITAGEKVRVVTEIDRGVTYPCTVIDVRGDFLGCRNESPGQGAAGYTQWFNLRLIVRIDRPIPQ